MDLWSVAFDQMPFILCANVLHLYHALYGFILGLIPILTYCGMYEKKPLPSYD